MSPKEGRTDLNVKLIQGIYDALAKGDAPTALGMFDPKIKWTEEEGFPTAGTYIGPDAVLEKVFKRLGADWEGFSVAPNEFIVDGDTVVALGWYGGKSKATGKSLRARFAHVWRIRNGKAIGFEQVADSAKVHEALH